MIIQGNIEWKYLILYFSNYRDESVRRAEEMFKQLDKDGNGDVTEVEKLSFIVWD